MRHCIQDEKYTWALAYIVDVELRCPSMTVSPPSNKTNTLGSHFLPLAKHLTWPASTQKHSTKTTLLTGAVPSVQTNVWQCWLLLTRAVPSVLTIFVFCLVCWLLLASDTADYCCSNPNKDFMRLTIIFCGIFYSLHSIASQCLHVLALRKKSGNFQEGISEDKLYIGISLHDHKR